MEFINPNVLFNRFYLRRYSNYWNRKDLSLNDSDVSLELLPRLVILCEKYRDKHPDQILLNTKYDIWLNI